MRFQSGLLRSGSVDIDVDVTGAQVLSLVVSDGGNGANFDWADWVEPRLVGPEGRDAADRPAVALAPRPATDEVQIDKSVVEKPLRLGDQTYARRHRHARQLGHHLPAARRASPASARTAGPDTGAIEQPGSQTSIELFVITGDRSLVETRAALALADPLDAGAGPPQPRAGRHGALDGRDDAAGAGADQRTDARRDAGGGRRRLGEGAR